MTIPAKALTVLTLGLSIAASTLPARSQQPGRASAASPDRIVGRMVEDMGKHLNLTPLQKARVTAVMKSAFAQRRAVSSNTALSPQQKRAKAAQIYSGMRKKVEAILTPAQRQKLTSMRFSAPQRLRNSFGGIDRDAKLLNMTPQQTTRMKAVVEKARAQRKAIRENAALQPEQKRAKTRQIMQTMHTQMNAILTPAQRQKVAAMRQQRVKQMQTMRSMSGNPKR